MLRPSLDRIALPFSWLLLAAAAAHAEDWPQFRGPTGQGHSSERSIPLDWSDTRNVVWKAQVPGTGWSSPVVADGRVWLTSSIAPDASGRATDASLRVLAFDAETGRPLVNKEVFHIKSAGLINSKNSRASPTPIVEGDRVYVHFGTDGTAALTTAGDIAWTTQLEYASQHGNGGSPVLYDDLLVLSCDGADTAFVVALDKRTGKVRWKTPRRRPYDQAYSTPLVIRVGDKDQIVSVGAYRTAAYDPKNGDEIWRASYPARFPDGFSNVMRPVYGHGMVFVSAGFNDAWMLAVRVDGTGDVTKTHIAWTLHQGAPLTPSPLLVGDQLYIVNDSGIAACLDAKTGTTIWRQRLRGAFSASPTFADGRIYFLSEEGEATAIAPGIEFRQLATSQLDGTTLASMAISSGSIFIRTGTHLYRIAQPKSAQLR